MRHVYQKYTVFSLCSFLFILLVSLQIHADEAATNDLRPWELDGDRIAPVNVNVFINTNSWNLILPDGEVKEITLRYVPEPQSVKYESDKMDIPFAYAGDTLTIQCDTNNSSEGNGEIVVQWPESRWTEAMQKFTEEDKTIPSMSGGVFFTGSSTARMWDVKKFFPGLNTLNRGFGGSQYWDLVCFAEPILGKHRPETIVIYSGDNDVSAGKSPERIVADCATSIQRFRKLTPESRIVVLAAKPSGSRWELYPVMQQANALIEKYVANIDTVFFLDLGYLLLDAEGKPDASCFLKDALHINDKGYQRWSDALTTFLNSLGK